MNKQVAAEASVRSSSRSGRAIFTINDKTIGGWRAADKKWFDPTNGLMVKIEQAVGGPTTG